MKKSIVLSKSELIELTCKKEVVINHSPKRTKIKTTAPTLKELGFESDLDQLEMLNSL